MSYENPDELSCDWIVAFMEGIELHHIMVHVLEAGLTFLEANNPKNRPSVKGFNIINGQLAESSDGAYNINLS